MNDWANRAVIEGGASIVAALFVLFSAMLNPKAAAIIAVLFLVAYATYKFIQSRFS
jgi:hypothetical protein